MINFEIDQNSVALIFNENTLLKDVVNKIPPVIVMNLVNVIPSNISIEKSKEIMTKNLYYIKHSTPDFFKKFEIKINDGKLEYKDKDIWRCQFDNGDQLYVLIDGNKKSEDKKFYILHIGMLKQFHSDLLKYEILNFPKHTIMDHYKTFHLFEKEILFRNSNKKIFQFSVENYFECNPEPVIDESAKKDDQDIKLQPPMSVPMHIEYLNDINYLKNRLYIMKNCSLHTKKTKGHLRLYTNKRIHWLHEKSENDDALKDLGKNYSPDDVYVYSNTCSGIKNSYGNELYKNLIISNPHCVYNIGNINFNQKNYHQNLMKNIPKLEKIYKEVSILRTYQLYK